MRTLHHSLCISFLIGRYIPVKSLGSTLGFHHPNSDILLFSHVKRGMETNSKHAPPFYFIIQGDLDAGCPFEFFFLGVKTTFETNLQRLFFVWLCFPSLMIPKWRIPIMSMDIGLYLYNQRCIHVWIYIYTYVICLHQPFLSHLLRRKSLVTVSAFEHGNRDDLSRVAIRSGSDKVEEALNIIHLFCKISGWMSDI